MIGRFLNHCLSLFVFVFLLSFEKSHSSCRKKKILKKKKQKRKKGKFEQMFDSKKGKSWTGF